MVHSNADVVAPNKSVIDLTTKMIAASSTYVLKTNHIVTFFIIHVLRYTVKPNFYR